MYGAGVWEGPGAEAYPSERGTVRGAERWGGWAGEPRPIAPAGGESNQETQGPRVRRVGPGAMEVSLGGVLWQCGDRGPRGRGTANRVRGWGGAGVGCPAGSSALGLCHREGSGGSRVRGASRFAWTRM